MFPSIKRYFLLMNMEEMQEIYQQSSAIFGIKYNTSF